MTPNRERPVTSAQIKAAEDLMNDLQGMDRLFPPKSPRPPASFTTPDLTEEMTCG